MNANDIRFTDTNPCLKNLSPVIASIVPVELNLIPATLGHRSRARIAGKKPFYACRHRHKRKL